MLESLVEKNVGKKKAAGRTPASEDESSSLTREEALRRAEAAIPEILEKITQKAKAGSCAHAKFVLEILDREGRDSGEGPERLAALLEEMTRSEESQATGAQD